MLFIVGNILCIALIVSIHEFGHYLAARLCGIIPTAFGIGIGPVLYRRSVAGTELSIGIILIGGFVSIPPEKLAALSRRKQIMVYLAGPCANLLTAILVGWVGASFGAVPDIVSGNPLVTILVFVLATILTPYLLFQIFVHPINSAGGVSGPLGVLSGQAMPHDLIGGLSLGSQMITVLYVISIAVGSFNLLPLSFLDGGRVMRVLIEQRFPTFARAWAGVSSMLLVALAVYALLADVVRLF